MHSRQVAVAEDLHARMLPVKIPNVVRKRPFLRFGTGVLTFGGGSAPGIDDMTADSIVTFRPVGDLPRIDKSILVVIREPLDSSVQMKKVCVADLSPPSAPVFDRSSVQ